MRGFGLAIVAGLAVGLSAAGRPADDAKDAKDAKAVVEKAIKAHGGADNLSKYTAIKQTIKGTITVQGMEAEITGETLTQYPDKVKATGTLSIAGMEVKITQVGNGDSFKMTVMGNEVPLPDEAKEELKAEMYATSLQQLTPLLKADAYTLTPVGEADVGGKPAVGVAVARQGQKDVKLFFDKESGLLVKVARRGKAEGGAEVDRESVFTDFKDVSGLKLPGKETVYKDGKKDQEIASEKIEVLEKADAKEFAADD